MVTQILSRAANSGVHLYLKDGRLAFKARTEALTAELKELIALHKTDIVQFLAAQQASGFADAAIVPGIFEHTKPALSFAQQRLWLLDQIEGGSSHYHIANAIKLSGELDVARLGRAFTAILNRHQSLRSCIAVDERGEPYQVILAATDFALAVADISFLSGAERAHACEKLLQESANAAFDLGCDLMLRAQLIKLSASEHILAVTLHHIAADGWSMAILINELIALYRADSPLVLPELPVQYADYAHWQRNWLQGARLQQQLDYWRSQLIGLPQMHSLPLDYPRPECQRFEGDHCASIISAELTSKLRAQCQAAGATLFMGLHAAFSVLLSRYSNECDIVVGSPIANREQAEIAGLIGFFVNTLVLRSDLSGEPSFNELLAQSKNTLLGAYAHQQVPFEQLVETLQPERSLSHAALFQIMLVLQNNQQGSLELPGLVLEPLAAISVPAKYDLTLTATENNKQISLVWEFNTQLFAAATIAKMASHFERLLGELLSQPDANVFALDILGDAEREQVQVWSLMEANCAQDQRCIHQLFEAQVNRAPDALAVTCAGESLSYQQLNCKANQLAHYLISKYALTPDTLIGLCLPRSLDMLVALVAILKAGGAYVPLDPDYPAARLSHMLEDARLTLVLTQTSLLDITPIAAGQALCVDDPAVQADLALLSRENPQRAAVNSSHLAYVIYTSGSTGKPKGVMIEHGNVTRLLASAQQDFDFTAEDVWTLFHSYAFDFSVWEIWGALAHGGRLVIVPQWIARSSADFYQLLQREGVTVLNQTPSAFAALMAEDALQQAQLALRYVIFGGEALNPGALSAWCERRGCEQPQLINMYGITETTVHVTYRRLLPADIATATGASLIGRPLKNWTMSVRNSAGQLVPQAVAGEMYVGGAGVARGYLNRPELTAERFVEVDGERCYRSGDAARLLASGELEYLGRLDQQVKIRGFRIELGEIEQALLQVPGVSAAVVMARDSHSGKQLVAYVVGSNPAEDVSHYLRHQLAACLPDYMVPAAFVMLDELPLTHNGKVNRALLPAPDMAQAQEHYVAPSTPTERILCSIWQELLGLERVGVNDNFFQLGGHSLLTVQVVARLQAQGIAASARQLFAAPSLADFAQELDAAIQVPAFVAPPNLIPIDAERLTPELLTLARLTADELDGLVEKVPGGARNIEDIYSLAPLQEGILFHHLLGAEQDPYILPSLFKLRDASVLTRFIAALDQVIARHAVLRTAIFWEGLPAPVQVVLRAVDVPIHRLDFDEQEAGGDIEARMKMLCASPCPPMDLTRAPLLNLHLATDPRSGAEYVLLRYHHIISDHLGLAVIQQELALLQAGLADQLPAPVPYRNQVAYCLQPELLSAAEAFFRKQLGAIDEPSAPFGLLDIRGDGSSLSEWREPVAAQLAAQIRQLTRQYGVSPAAFFHTAWALVVSACAGREQIIFGTVMSGRLQGVQGAERALGVFINSLPLAVQLAGQTTIGSLRQIHQSLVELLPYEQAPLADIQAWSSLPKGVPLFSALLNYRHSLDFSVSANDDFVLLDGRERTNYPFTLSVDDDDSGFGLELQLDQSLNAERIIGYLRQALQVLVEVLQSAPQTPISTLSILPAAERQQLLVDANQTATDYPDQASIQQLFESRVALTPEAIAVTDGERALTYAQLNRRANQLAHYLAHQYPIAPESLVAVCLDRSLEMVIALVAILKTGAAYVPLDADSPEARLASVLQDTGASCLITQQSCAIAFSGTCIALDDSQLYQQLAQLPDTNPANAGTANSLAYVIYTSGSTGKPKGVMVEQRAVVRLVRATNYINLSSATVMALASNMAFDAMTFELWGALLNGGRAVVVARDELINPYLLQAKIAREQINCLFITTALLHSMALDQPEALAGLEYLLFGGEDCSLPLVQKISAIAAPQHLLHVYGPTENTTFSLWKRLTADYLATAAKIALGQPLSNSTAFVLNTAGEPVPLGVQGELYLGGHGLARGYLNHPDLSAEKFSETRLGQRLYRTGDLVKQLANGDLEFVGRVDHQVKIRGFRIELGEIEACLRSHALVRDAIVLARDTFAGSGDKRLIAYLVAEADGADCTASIQAWLHQQLPVYMQPSALLVVPALPLNANGKIDRSALPEPELLSRTEFIAPESATQQQLSLLWQSLLTQERVGLHDNFFDLGGHSLLATRLLAQVNREFGIALVIRDLFALQTLAEQAAYIDEQLQMARGFAEQAVEEGAEVWEL